MCFLCFFNMKQVFLLLYIRNLKYTTYIIFSLVGHTSHAGTFVDYY